MIGRVPSLLWPPKSCDYFIHLGKQPYRKGKVIARAAVDYILQLNSTYDSCMINIMLLKVDMTGRLLLKVNFYDDDNKT